jgi:hypothetical protein
MEVFIMSKTREVLEIRTEELLNELNKEYNSLSVSGNEDRRVEIITELFDVMDLARVLDDKERRRVVLLDFIKDKIRAH